MRVTQGCVGGSNGLLFITRLSRSGEFIRLTDNEDVRDRKATIFVKNIYHINITSLKNLHFSLFMKTSHDYLHFVRVVMLFSSYVVDQIRFYTSLRKMQILSLRILKKYSQAFVFQYMILRSLVSRTGR